MIASLLAVTAPLAAVALIIGFRRAPAMFAACGALVSFGGAVGGLVDASAGGHDRLTLGGLPDSPLQLQHDALTAVLSLTVATVALLVVVYAVGYMQADPAQVRFFAEMSFFVAAMQGLVLAGDWILLLACWELIGLASYLLIGFWYERPLVPAAATRAFLTTRGADLGLYVAIFALVTTAGTTEIGPTLAASQGQFVVGILLLLAAMGKSAQVPFQGWLQDAMLGPTPVSALLHSATLVAAGAILLIRSAALFSGPMLATVAAVGGLTILVTGVMALAQPDLKRMLAASTSSQLGFMLIGIGAGSPVAALVHLVAHAAMKAALFLGAGIFQHAVDSTAFAELRGVGRAFLSVFSLFALAGLALAGVPPLSGFWSKDALEAAALAAPAGPFLLPLVLVGSLLTAAYVTRALRLLWQGSAPRRPVHGMSWMLVGLAGLSMLAAFLGPSLEPIARLVGETLPASVTAQLLGLGVMAVGLLVGWSGFADRLVAPIALAAAQGFRVGDGWIDVVARPGLMLARALAHIDAVIDRAVRAVGSDGLQLARASRRFDDVDLNGLIGQLVRVARWLGERAQRLQTGFVSRELLLAAAGTAVILVLALAVR
jgi:NADH-quinone oxidoreductase subunit L